MQVVGIKRYIFNILVEPICQILNIANRFSVSLVEKIRPIDIKRHIKTEKKMAFVCKSSLALWRSKTLYTKEPDTINWINSFNNNDVFYDIGANVGTYTIYAGLIGVKVYAFEPEAKNYSCLNENISLNSLHDTVRAYPLAIGNSASLNDLYISSSEIGGAINNFGAQIDYNGRKMDEKFIQGSISVTLDQIWSDWGLSQPTHIKIDVDGLEAEIIRGAKKTLLLMGLKSILIELDCNSNKDMEIIRELETVGFICVGKYHSPMFDGGEYDSIYNHIFERNL